MNFLIKRKFYTRGLVISELYIDDKFISLIKEDVKGNIFNIIPKGKYDVKQFYSVKMKKIVYGLKEPSNKIFTDKSRYFILQKGGDFDVLNGVKFPYRFSQKNYKINIS